MSVGIWYLYLLALPPFSVGLFVKGYLIHIARVQYPIDTCKFKKIKGLLRILQHLGTLWYYNRC